MKYKFRIIAVIVCFLILILHALISVSIGWKHGGGVFAYAILFVLFSFIWRTAKAWDKKHRKKGENSTTMPDMPANDESEKVSTEQAEVEEAPLGETYKKFIEPEEMYNVALHEYESNGGELTIEPIDDETVKPQLHKALKIALIVLMCWEFLTQLNVIGIVTNIGLFGMYIKKRWGLIVELILFGVFAIVGILDVDMAMVVFSIVTPLILGSLLLLRNDGYPAWKTIWNNGKFKKEVEENAVVEEKSQVLEEDLPPVPTIVDEEKITEVETAQFTKEQPMSVESGTNGIEQSIARKIQAKIKKIVENMKQQKRIWFITGIIVAVIGIVGGVLFYQNYQRKQKYNTLVAKAKDAEKDGLNELSIIYLKEAQGIDDSKWESYYLIGSLYMPLDPDSANVYLAKAYSLNEKKEDGFLGENVKYNSLLFNYSFILVLLGNNEKALVVSQEYYSLYPDDKDAYLMMSFAYSASGNEIKAKEWKERMYERFPE